MRRLIASVVLFASLLFTPSYAGFPGSGAGYPRGTCAAGNDSFTKVLLHMDGANAGTSFPDTNAGGVSATWSVTGSATTTTSTFRFGTASYQGAASSYIQSNQNSPYNAGSSDFTIDFWIRGSAANATTLQYIAGYGDSSLTNNIGWFIYYDASKFLRASFQNSSGSNYQTNTGATTVIDGNWHHIAYVKTSSSTQIYIDGVATGSSVSPSGSMRTGTYQLQVGQAVMASGTNANPFLGNIDEFRYSIGIARWTTNFTPSGLPWCN